MYIYLSLLLFNLANLVNANVCEQFDSLNSCIDNPICQWCNSTSGGGNSSDYSGNIRGTCNMNTQCLYNNTECVNSRQLNYMCSLLNFFLLTCLFFILFASMFYISYGVKNIPNVDGGCYTTVPCQAAEVCTHYKVDGRCITHSQLCIQRYVGSNGGFVCEG